MGNEQIHAGDVVMLKSGGPPMTVRWVEEKEAFCDWFDGKNDKSARYMIWQLTKNKD